MSRVFRNIYSGTVICQELMVNVEESEYRVEKM